MNSDQLILLDHPGIRSEFKCALSFPGVHKRGSAVPTRASYAFMYSTFTYVGAVGPDPCAGRDWANPCALLLVSPLIRAGSKSWPEPMRGCGVGGGECSRGVREELMVSLNAWEPVTLCQR